MPVLPSLLNVFQDRQRLYQFLSNCHQICIEKKRFQTVSISLTLPPVDPLAVLQVLGQPQQLHFYLEQGNDPTHPSQTPQRVAIAAIGTALSAQFSGSQRFIQAKDFIQTSLQQILTAGETHSPFSGPHFFCGFTFFDRVADPDPVFPPATLFLPRWQITTTFNQSIAVCNLVLQSHTNLDLLLEQIWQELTTLKTLQYHSPPLEYKSPKQFHLSTHLNTALLNQTIQNSLREIDHQNLHKVVLAHAIDVTSPIPIHLISSLGNLRRLYPDCAVFSMGNGRGQQFIGASPERLLRIRNRQLTTDALAGSSPRGQTALEDAQLASRLLNNEKELREHQMVADFISQRLMGLGLLPRPAASPVLMQLSNIQHLHTPIHAPVPAQVHPLDIVAALHPTPAVAGVPQGVACDYIRQHEPFERSLYAAPLGWIDHRGNSEFIVGIRSALINGPQARLYAGAGIVAGSNPDKELAEIQLKLQVLLGTLV